MPYVILIFSEQYKCICWFCFNNKFILKRSTDKWINQNVSTEKKWNISSKWLTIKVNVFLYFLSLSKLVYIVKINLTFIACFIKQFALYSQKHLPVNFSLKNTPREHPAEITGFLFCYSYQQTWLLLLLLLFLWTFFLLLLLYGLI